VLPPDEVGRGLRQESLTWLAGRACREATVATQARNDRAQQLCQRACLHRRATQLSRTTARFELAIPNAIWAWLRARVIADFKIEQKLE
jgi:hypothetical protein